MEEKGHIHFWGTYFDKDAVMRVERWARITGWAILAAYIIEAGYSTYQNIYNSIVGNYPLDFYFLFSNFAHILQGGMLCIVLQAVAKITLILLDIEENTRRAARKPEV
jgi:hypothetical protein